MASKKRILSIRVKSDVDYSPDLSFLGEYKDHGDGNNVIDRKDRGDWERGQCRFCHITLSAEETGNPNSVYEDYARLEAYNRGDWCMVGVWAEAEVVLTGNCVQKIRSGGLWGIESDSGEYLTEVAKEEVEQLKDELIALGFRRSTIDKVEVEQCE